MEVLLFSTSESGMLDEFLYLLGLAEARRCKQANEAPLISARLHVIRSGPRPRTFGWGAVQEFGCTRQPLRSPNVGRWADLNLKLLSVDISACNGVASSISAWPQKIRCGPRPLTFGWGAVQDFECTRQPLRSPNVGRWADLDMAAQP